MRQIAAAVEVVSETRFWFEGRPCRVGQPRPLFAPSFPAPSEGCSPAIRELIGTLRDELYGRWFTRARPATDLRVDAPARRAHLHNLSAAGRGGGVWEPGWSFRRFVDPTCVEVDHHGIVFTVDSDRVRPADPNPVAGTPCRVHVPVETRGLLPGFWVVQGEADPWQPQETPWLLRLYWNLRAPTAPRLVHLLTSGFNECRIAFRLKLIDDPRFFIRADAGVLYLDPRQWESARPVVRRCYREIAGELRPEVPRLAAALAPGLGLSEGRADGGSFGSERCGLIARALAAAFQAATNRPSERCRAVADAFVAAGLDPQRPQLAPGSASDYPPFEASDTALPRPLPRPAGPRGESGPEEVAAEIGDALCASAFRHDGCCNWIGSFMPPDPDGSRTAMALGADLYGGTAGIALFLAELYRVTGDRQHQRTAVAAQRQALEAVRNEPQSLRPIGFYDGQLGVAWAARRVAVLAASEALEREGNRLLGSLLPTLPEPRSPDIISGSAGAILALLRLQDETGNDVFLKAAARLGSELVRDALAGIQFGTSPALTGFGHGAAGIGLALLELGLALGASDLGQAADRVFDYEDSCFDAPHGNWPDLRGWTAGSGRVPGFMVAWCHGATGIALSRLRAITVDPARASRYEGAARAGLAATLEQTLRDLDRPGAGLSLCHGLAGMTEVVSLGAELFDEPALRDRAGVARERLPRLARSARGSADPSLFTGAAGVGHALLRLSRPERVPSLLLPAAASPI